MKSSYLAHDAALMGLGMAAGLALAYFGGYVLWALAVVLLVILALWGGLRRDLHDATPAVESDWSVMEKYRGDPYS